MEVKNMAKTSLGEFIVKEMNGKNERVNISIFYNHVAREKIDEIESKLTDFIKDIGKYEMLVKGFSSLIDIGLPLKKQTSDITNLDFDFKKTGDFKHEERRFKTQFYLYLYAKTDEITNRGKELLPNKIDIMIENIDKYQSMREMLKLIKSEILD